MAKTKDTGSTASQKPGANLPHPLVPRAARALCDIARGAGLDVSAVTIEQQDDVGGSPRYRLVSKWSGPGHLFAATGLFTPAQCRLLGSPLPISRWISNPLCSPGGLDYDGIGCNLDRFGLMVFTGRAWGTANSMSITVNLGPLPLAVEMHGAVEISTTPDLIFWHGAVADLIAAGIPRGCLPLGKQSGRRARRFGCAVVAEFNTPPEYEARRWWAARRQPDGSIVYCHDTRGAFDRRVMRDKEEWRRDFEAAVPDDPDGETARSESATPLRLPPELIQGLMKLDANGRDEVVRLFISVSHLEIEARARAAATVPTKARSSTLRLVVDNTREPGRWGQG